MRAMREMPTREKSLLLLVHLDQRPRSSPAKARL